MQKTAIGLSRILSAPKPTGWRNPVTKFIIVMKLTIVLLTVALMQVHARGLSQTVTISGKDLPLKTIFSAIKTQTGFSVFSSKDLLESGRPVTLSVYDMPLGKFLDVVMKDQPLNFRIDGKDIILSRKEAVIAPVVENPNPKTDAPPVEITIIVKDASGQPLDGASVREKGTDKGTMANLLGKAVLKLSKPNSTIIVSFTGYEAQQINVEDRTEILVVLKASDNPLDAIQIQAYGKTSRRLSTGNITTVRAADIEKQNVNNPIMALQGRVPGLQITPSSGMPGTGVSIQLRGQNSLYNASSPFTIKTEPLYVIDGVPYVNTIDNIQPGISTGAAGVSAAFMSALSFIDPSMIESIDVLKDADATSIYGSRGANGVILITTKKGKAGTARVNVTASAGYGKVPKFLDMMNTQEYLAMRREAFSNDGITPSSNPFANPYDPVSPQGYAPDLTLWDQNRYTNWQKMFLGGTAKQYNARAELSGGTSLVQYMISGTYNKQGYVFPGDGGSTIGSGHFSLTGYSPNQKLRLSLSTDYSSTKNTPPQGNLAQLAVTLPPNAPALFKLDGALNWEPNPTDGRATWQHPYQDFLKGYEVLTNVISSSADVSYKFIENLELKTSVGFTKLEGNSFTSTPIASYEPVLRPVAKGSALFQENGSKTWSVEPQLNYNTSIGLGRLSILIGTSVQSQQASFQLIRTNGYTNDAFLRSLSASSSDRNLYNTSSEYKYAAAFTRISYNWEDRYLINLNGRRDGSSRFGDRNKFGNFASVGAAWIFSKENFIQKTLPWLSFGKLRFSYGSSGNDGISDYAYFELYETSQRALPSYQGVTSVYSSGLNNPSYHWEDVRKLEYGMELGFFKDRIILSAVYWRNRASDQLGKYSIATQAGPTSNLFDNQDAKIQNSGGEFTLSAVNVRGKNFSWTINGNLSIQRNKLLSVPKDVNGNAIGFGVYQIPGEDPVGKPFSGFVQIGYISRGVDQVTGQYLFADKEGHPAQWGGTANIERPSRIMTQPKFSGGFGQNFSFKRFSLDLFFQFTKQNGLNYLYQFYGLSQLSIDGLTGNLPKIYASNTWTADKTNALFQKLTQNGSGPYDNTYSLTTRSDIAYTDASFLRLKTLSLSYSIPVSLKQKLHLENLRIFIQGQNLLTFTKYKGNDPETQSPFGLPPLRVITAGIQIQL